MGPLPLHPSWITPATNPSHDHVSNIERQWTGRRWISVDLTGKLQNQSIGGNWVQFRPKLMILNVICVELYAEKFILQGNTLYFHSDVPLSVHRLLWAMQSHKQFRILPGKWRKTRLVTRLPFLFCAVYITKAAIFHDIASQSINDFKLYPDRRLCGIGTHTSVARKSNKKHWHVLGLAAATLHSNIATYIALQFRIALCTAAK